MTRLCACGCGNATKPHTRTNQHRGHVKGELAERLPGHSSKPRRGPYQPHAPRPGTPKCRRKTLAGPVCRALDCRKPMHRGNARRCVEGHPRHACRGICDNCRKRVAAGAPVELGPFEQPRMRPDEVLDEWAWLRGEVRWRDFGDRVGLEFQSWRQMFHRAAAQGDPRAVKAAGDLT